MSSKNVKSEAWDWIKSIGIAIIIALIIRTFLFNSTRVVGDSMMPTLKEDDRLITNKIEYMITEPERGEIVILQAPDDENKDYVKRIIGVGGDMVEIVDGSVYLNGQLLEEDYISSDAYTHAYDEYKWEIPEGYYFVLGDNREFRASKDSRSLGLIPEDLIRGRASLRYFPMDRIGLLLSSFSI